MADLMQTCTGVTLSPGGFLAPHPPAKPALWPICHIRVTCQPAVVGFVWLRD